MPAFLLSLLARPAILASVIGGLAVIGMGIALKVEKSRHARDVASLTLQVKDAQLMTANEKNARGIVEKNRERLVFEVMMQNEMIEDLVLEKKRAEQAGAAAAVRALARGRAEADALRAPTSTVPPGHAAMNLWLSGRMAPP